MSPTRERFVYVVTAGEYSDYHIVAVCLTRSAATQCAVTYGAQRDDTCGAMPYRVEKHRVYGGRVASVKLTYYAILYCESGRIATTPPRREVWLAGQRGNVSPLVRPDLPCLAKSCVSQGHAKKLAVERRQKWLRERA